MTRRQFAQATAGAVALGATTTVSAQQGSDYGGWFDDVSNYDGTVDKTGQDTVEITVGAEGNNGAFAFAPAAVRVSPGTEVVWTWTGNGGGHNVVSDGDGPLDSGGLVSEKGTTYAHTFESEGVFKYVCEPHAGLGMKGAVVVGSESGGSTATATASGDSESGGENATSGEGGRTGSASGPVTALAAVITMAFFSPLAFAAFMRRKARQTDRRR